MVLVHANKTLKMDSPKFNPENKQEKHIQSNMIKMLAHKGIKLL